MPLTRVAAGFDRGILLAMRQIWLSEGDPTTGARRDEQERTFAAYADGPLQADPHAFFPKPPAAEIERYRRVPLPGGWREKIRWKSGYQAWNPDYRDAYSAYEANDTAWAEWWRHKDGGRPTLIAVHSWATSQAPIQEWVFSAWRMYLAGWDVVLPILPFHGRRTPRQAMFSGQLFPGTRPGRCNEAFGQAAWDIRGLMYALRARGCGPIGVAGASLGGYTSAMLAGLEPELAFCIPVIPMVSFGDILWTHGEGGPQRQRAEEQGITVERLREVFSPHSPLRWTPAIPKERILIVAGRGDRVCPPEHIEWLWEHWDRPRIAWFSGGHVLHFGRRQIRHEVKDFLQGLQIL